MSSEMVYIRHKHLIGILSPDTGEVEIWTKGTDSVNGGRGMGDMRAVLKVWEYILVAAKAHGMSSLVCEPTKADGRGDRRFSVYRRLGFAATGEYLMEADVNKALRLRGWA